MQYVTQTITIQHRIAADEALTKEVLDSITADTRGLLYGKGNALVFQCGYGLSCQAGRGEEAEAQITVSIGIEEITEGELVPNG